MVTMVKKKLDVSVPCLDVGCSHDGVAQAVNIAHTNGSTFARKKVMHVQ
jgi:hypothetical protein